jgi:hypothetical protein
MNIGDSMKLFPTNSSLLGIMTGLNLSTEQCDGTHSTSISCAQGLEQVLPSKTAYLPETFLSFLRYLHTGTEIEKLHHKHVFPHALNLLFADHIFTGSYMTTSVNKKSK